MTLEGAHAVAQDCAEGNGWVRTATEVRQALRVIERRKNGWGQQDLFDLTALRDELTARGESTI